uniref:Uncharacterized protein n=1 Tax=Astyanax mexicanus TaxID=7994 RepID=A0A3B1JTK4_ASTMX
LAHALDSLVRVSRRVGWVAGIAADPERPFVRRPVTLETCCGYGYGPARDLHPLPRIFKGQRELTGRRQSRGAFQGAGPYLGVNPFQGALPFTKKRELFPVPPLASPGSFALPHWAPRGAYLRHSGFGDLNPTPFRSAGGGGGRDGGRPAELHGRVGSGPCYSVQKSALELLMGLYLSSAMLRNEWRIISSAWTPIDCHSPQQSDGTPLKNPPTKNPPERGRTRSEADRSAPSSGKGVGRRGSEILELATLTSFWREMVDQ